MKEKKIRLLVIGPTLGTYGGLEAFMIAVAKVATQWKGFEVRMCFKIVKGNKFTQNLMDSAKKDCPHVDFVQRGSSKLLGIISWADVLHVQNTPPDIIFPAKFLGKKIFLTIHNWRRTHSSFHNILWGWAMKMADQRWYNSKFVWDTWEGDKKYKNSAAFPTVSELPSGWIPIAERKGFVFMGRWIVNKGIEEILKAYKISGLDHLEFPLTIIGDGPLRPKVEALIIDLGLSGKVNLPGFVSSGEKGNLLRHSKWLLAPAKTKEDLGLTPIEARCVGVPAIVTRDGGLPEAGGPAAFVVEPDDVSELAEYMIKAAKMGDQDYLKRSELAKSSLKDFLVPMEFYRTAFSS